jgi:hypothetical protein
MDFIFEHEQLRIDEIARKINVKNSFTPLKPLKSFQLNRRRNTIQHDSKDLKSPKAEISSYSSKRKEMFRSISPVLHKFMEIDWKQKSLIDFKVLPYANAEKSEKNEKNENELKPVFKSSLKQVLPEIRKNKASHFKEFGKKDLKKHSRNFIAFIPTVAYLNNC